MTHSVDSYRNDFELDPELIYLNSGSHSICPTSVIEAIEKYQREGEKNPTEYLFQAWGKLWSIQKQLADFFNADPADLFLRPSVTAALNVFLMGVPLPKKSEILVTDLEYGAIVNTCRYRAEKEGHSIRTLSLSMAIETYSDLTEDQLVQWIVDSLRPETKLLLISHVMTTNGLVIPLEKLAQVTRQKNILLVVDGAHGPGAVPIDFRQLQDVDFYGGNLHKWMLGPKGTAFGWVPKRHQDTLEILEPGWTTFDVPYAFQAFGEGSRFQTKFMMSASQNFAPFFALKETLDYWKNKTPKSIFERIDQLRKFTYEKFQKEIGWKALSPKPGKLLGPLVTFELPQAFSELGYDWMLRLQFYHKLQIATPPVRDRNALRISPHIYNTEQEISQAIEILKNEIEILNLELSETIHYKIRYEERKNCDNIRKTLPAHFCPMPFSTMIVNPDGKVGFCRERTNNDVIGDLRDQSLEEIWNGNTIRSIRKEFLTGNIKTCAEQIRDRRCFEQNYNQAILPHIELSEFQSKPPIRLSPDLNGKCNLRCNMCTIWQMPNGFYDEIDFWDKAQKDIFPNLLMIDPLAGEPFVQKDFYRLVDKVTSVNSKCVWRLTTNLHWKFNEKIKETLDKISHFQSFICSIDALTPETYYKIRHPGRLELVRESLAQLISYRRERVIKRGPNQKFGITVAMAVQINNWKEAPDYMRWAHNLGVEPALQGVYFPEHLSIFKIQSDDKRREILDYFIEKMDFRDLIHTYRITTPLADSLPADEARSYKFKIAEAFMTKILTMEDLMECNHSFPRFLESFKAEDQLELARKLLKFIFRSLDSIQIKLAGYFVYSTILFLPEIEQNKYMFLLQSLKF